MSPIDDRLAALGIALPPPPQPPPGFAFPFSWVRVRGSRVFLSGHGAQAIDGSPQGPFGKVPSTVSLDQAQASARAAVVSMVASLQRELGDLDRIAAWLMVFGHVNADPGFEQTTLVLNPASQLLLDIFGPEVGSHARTALGQAALPVDLPVIIAAEIELHH